MTFSLLNRMTNLQTPLRYQAGDLSLVKEKVNNMIDITQAQEIIKKNFKIFLPVERPLTESYGETLREDIFADRDQPAFDKVLMDGIAINFAIWKTGCRNFKIQGIQAAGMKAGRLKRRDYCIEVMTGAVLPEGTDCVIPVEQIQVQSKKAKIDDGVSLQRMQNILRKGADYRSGERLLRRGISLCTPAVAVVAAVGKKTVKVSSRPKVAIIGTGDELVDVGRPIKIFQIRTSNSYALQAALQKNGFCETQIFHLKDHATTMRKEIRWILKTFDVLILSGGVSMGKFDYVPQVLAELGVKVLFHKVRQKPGKPFWFGVKKGGAAVFALPGNPVSTLVCFYRYVLPQLKRSLGLTKISKEYAVLTEAVRTSASLTYFLPVVVDFRNAGQLIATPISTSGSGDYLALAQSDGFVELGAGSCHFSSGTEVPLYRW